MVPLWRFQYFRHHLQNQNLILMSIFPNNHYWAYTFPIPWALNLQSETVPSLNLDDGKEYSIKSSAHILLWKKQTTQNLNQTFFIHVERVWYCFPYNILAREYVRIREPALDSQMGWTGELCPKTKLLYLAKLRGYFFFWGGGNLKNFNLKKNIFKLNLRFY